jgi:hypothetical protein
MITDVHHEPCPKSVTAMRGEHIDLFEMCGIRLEYSAEG